MYFPNDKNFYICAKIFLCSTILRNKFNFRNTRKIKLVATFSIEIDSIQNI